MADRIEELTRRAADDAVELARESAGVAGREAMAAGVKAIVPLVVTALGALFWVVGAGAIALSPALRADAGRMRRFGAAYLVVGAVGSIGGLLALGRDVQTAFPRTRRTVGAVVEAVRDHA